MNDSLNLTVGHVAPLLAAQITWPSIVEAVAISLQALVVVVALWYARGQLEIARALREDQTRPFVVIDFDVDRHRPLIYVVIQNHGSTIARDVHFTFDPPISSAWDDEKRKARDLRVLAEGIPTLVPRAEIAILFDSAIGRGSEHADSYDVTISYADQAGRIYNEPYRLDLGIHRDLHYIDVRTLDDVAKELEDIGKTMKGWSESDSLHIRTDDDVARLHEQRRERFMEWRATQAEEPTEPDD